MNIAGAGKRLMQRYLRTESDDRNMDFSFTVLGVAERIQHIANGIIHIADFLSAHAAADIEKKHDW
ncbi:purine nucleoside phosphorylase [Pseudomonas aeruginosa NCGM2.S1]|nr:purine nucleoside phosphorylase [Pseudomonas aeruginosa NCGM2.S1]